MAKIELLKHIDANVLPLFREASLLANPCETLLDVGCGIRPQALVPCKRHICLEPHGEYAQALREHGYEVIEDKAPNGLIDVDTIVALDVIEHMERADGEAFVKRALECAKQVVIFTPLGFMPQEELGVTDAWGLNGQEWQRHRSGWIPDDFPGWTTIVQQSFHNRHGTSYGAFFAIYG